MVRVRVRVIVTIEVRVRGDSCPMNSLQNIMAHAITYITLRCGAHHSPCLHPSIASDGQIQTTLDG